MNKLDRRQRQICRQFAALRNDLNRVEYDDLISGKYGEPVQYFRKDKIELCIDINENKTNDGRPFFFYFEPPKPMKKGAQPLSDESKRRVNVPLRLPQYIKLDLQGRTGTMSSLIETAIVEFYQIEKGE